MKEGRLWALLFQRKNDWLEVHFASVRVYIKQTGYLFLSFLNSLKSGTPTGGIQLTTG